MSVVQLLYYGYAITFLSVWVAAGYWIYTDATVRDLESPILWAIASVVFFPIGIYYLISNPLSTTTNNTPTTEQNRRKIFAISGILGFIISAILAPPDFITQWFYWIAIFAVLFPAIVYLNDTGKYTIPSR